MSKSFAIAKRFFCCRMEIYVVNYCIQERTYVRAIKGDVLVKKIYTNLDLVIAEVVYEGIILSNIEVKENEIEDG